MISPTPLALSPEDLTLLSNDLPEFTWEPISLAYPFSYRIDIVRVDQNIQSLVQTISDIPSTAVSMQATDTLASGEYFWTISIVDEFGNMSRSREAGLSDSMTRITQVVRSMPFCRLRNMKQTAKTL